MCPSEDLNKSVEKATAKVSIVVPIYNVEEYLPRCLESLRIQTCKDIEVLCVNDGSTDESQQVIDRFVAQDPRFLSFIKKNGGLSDARNYGLKHCCGEYVMFIDSDDFVEPEMIDKSLEKALSDNLDMVVFDFNQYYLATDTRERIDNRFDEKTVYSLKQFPELLCYVNNAAWNKLYRKRLFVENHIEYPFGFRHQDLGTTPKLLYLAERIGFVRTPLYNYLIDRPDNLTQQYDTKIYHIIDMNREYLEFFKTIGEFETYYEELKYLCIVNILNSLKKVTKFTDTEFVEQFIDDVYAFILSYFEDYPKCDYRIYSTKEDRIYLNKRLLKLYVKYHQWKEKRR